MERYNPLFNEHKKCISYQSWIDFPPYYYDEPNDNFRDFDWCFSFFVCLIDYSVSKPLVLMKRLNKTESSVLLYGRFSLFLKHSFFQIILKILLRHRIIRCLFRLCTGNPCPIKCSRRICVHRWVKFPVFMRVYHSFIGYTCIRSIKPKQGLVPYLFHLSLIQD